MSELFDTINKKYSSIKLLNVFTDLPTSQFKQHFLFSNLHGWENEFNFKIVWNFFANSRGKGTMDRISDTVKRLAWRNVRITTAVSNDAVAYCKLAKCLNMGIAVTYILNDTIREKCAQSLPVWDDNIVVADTMKLHCIKVRNSWQLEVAAFSRDETFKVENILRAIVTDGNDTESDLGLNGAEGNIGDDVLDPDQVIPDNIIINIKDWVLNSYEGFQAFFLLSMRTSVTYLTVLIHSEA